MTEGLDFTADWFSKPGDSVRSQMARRQITADRVAEHLDGGIVTLKGLLAGTTAVDERHARSLSVALGGTAGFWLRRQANYDEAMERAVDRTMDDDAEVSAWLQLQVPGDRPRGRMSAATRRVELRRRLSFFNVGTMDAWHARYGRICSDTLFRTSQAFESEDSAVLMWLRSGEIGTDVISTRPWNAGNLQDRLDEIRKLSQVRQPARFLPKLKTLCAEAGVAVVTKRAPERCRASGASRMVAPDKAMILLSFRGLSDDRFWFTVFHEIGHLLLHGARTFVDADMEELDQSEREANEFAARVIIPDNRVERFGNLTRNRDDVVRFSVETDVSPGLTVGQMQHRRMIGPTEMNYLKRFWKWPDLAAVLD